MEGGSSIEARAKAILERLDNAPYNAVCGNIHVGAIEAVEKDGHRWDAVCSIVHSYPQEEIEKQLRKGVPHMHIVLKDSKHSDIAQHFDATYEFLKLHTEKERVLIHCMAGMSRSVTIAANYMLQDGLFDTVEQTLVHIQHRRPIARPNVGFVIQLLQRFPQSEDGALDDVFGGAVHCGGRVRGAFPPDAIPGTKKNH